MIKAEVIQDSVSSSAGVVASRTRTAEYRYTGVPCKRGHVGPRYSNGNCVECLLERERAKYRDPDTAARKKAAERRRYQSNRSARAQAMRSWRARNSYAINAKQRFRYASDPAYRAYKVLHSAEYRRRYPERVAASNLAYYTANKEKRLAANAAYRAHNLDSLLPRMREYSREHYRRNRDYYWLKKQRRRLMVRQQTPAWASIAEILRIRRRAAQLAASTGVQMSVDHVVPLRGVDRCGAHVVCGLHWEGNLQVVPLADNKKKSNRIWKDQP